MLTAMPNPAPFTSLTAPVVSGTLACWLLAALLALPAAPASAGQPASVDSLEQLLYAQQSTDLAREQIYQVELLVFAQGNFDGTGQRSRAGGELFADSAAQLDYQQPMQMLYSPAQLDQLRPLFQQRQAILSGFQTAQPGDAPSTPTTGAEALATAVDSAEAAALENDTELPPPPLPQLMVANAPAASLAEHARQLRRAGGYRILFQGSWHQHLESRKRAPWVPLSGGRQYGNHHELEGSIKLSRDRYLHITTDLWRSNFAGSSMPSPAPVNGSALLSLRDTASNAEPPLALPPAPAPSLALLGMIEGWYQKSYQRLAGEMPSDSEENPEVSNGAYPTNSSASRATEVAAAARLQQYRRMRSGEIHYLDHPLLGVIIKLTPWDAG